MTEPVAFVNDPEFLRSAFDFGLTLDDGVRELVDNALDAQATNIQVIIKTTKHALHLIVQDNGEGIPDMIEDEGEQFQGIPFIMSFGAGKNFMPRKKGDIGRFGVGLSATITCLTREHGWQAYGPRMQETKTVVKSLTASVKWSKTAVTFLLNTPHQVLR